MKAHLWRWAKRVFFGLIVVVGVFTALYLIAATLFSNMTHSDKISLYIIIGYALCCYLVGDGAPSSPRSLPAQARRQQTKM